VAFPIHARVSFLQLPNNCKTTTEHLENNYKKI
jgi:hypothetical protein